MILHEEKRAGCFVNYDAGTYSRDTVKLKMGNNLSSGALLADVTLQPGKIEVTNLTNKPQVEHVKANSGVKFGSYQLTVEEVNGNEAKLRLTTPDNEDGPLFVVSDMMTSSRHQMGAFSFTLTPGTTLFEVEDSVIFDVINGAPAISGSGDATLSNLRVKRGATTGSYFVEKVGETSGGDQQFVLKSPNGPIDFLVGDSNAHIDNPHLSFDLSLGATPPAVGDKFNIVVHSNSDIPIVTEWNPQVHDSPMGILYGPADATLEPQYAVAVVRHSTLNMAELEFPANAGPSDKRAACALFKAQGVKIQ